MAVVIVPETPTHEKTLLLLGSTAALLVLLLLGLAAKVGYIDSQKTPNPPAVALRYRSLADRLVKEGKALQAVEAYAKAIQSAATPDAGLFSARGDAWMFLKEHSKAGSDYDRAIALAPGVPYNHMAKAMSLALSGRIQEALEAADQAVRLDPRFALAYFWRAYAEDRLGRLKEAEQDYGKAIELEPSAAHYRTARAMVRLRLKDLLGVRQDIEAAAKLDPKMRETPLYRSLVSKTR